MQHTRPKNLNLLTIRFPLPAIASILHRISGFVLFLLIPVMLWLLSMSLDYDGFDNLQLWFSRFYVKFFCWLLVLPFCYHLIAGIRHLFSDIHIGNTRAGGKRASVVVFILFGLLALAAGVWIW